MLGRAPIPIHKSRTTAAELHIYHKGMRNLFSKWVGSPIAPYPSSANLKSCAGFILWFSPLILPEASAIPP